MRNIHAFNPKPIDIYVGCVAVYLFLRNGA